MGAPAGKMLDSLKGASLGPEDIGTVVVSHAHPDHIGGLTRREGGARVAVFGKAVHCFSKKEWEFWTTDASAGMPDSMRAAAEMTLPAVGRAGLVELVEEEVDVLPGVRLVPAPGHTPGHVAVVIISGSEGVLYLADAVLHEAQFEHPEWVTPMDAIPNLTVRTRRRLLEQAVRESRPVIGFHLAARGRVERRGNAFRLSPA